VKPLITVLVFLAFVPLLGRAIDIEIATAGGVEARELYQGKPIEWWARRTVQARKDANARARTIRRMRQELRRRYEPSSRRAIALASTAYRVSFATLYRKAGCETGWTFSPYAKNPRSSASGLFQFLVSTWATTPYAGFSIWDPYANALAAGWMHDVGRGGEWACK
jgi:hypothetical protein